MCLEGSTYLPILVRQVVAWYYFPNRRETHARISTLDRDLPHTTDRRLGRTPEFALLTLHRETVLDGFNFTDTQSIRQLGTSIHNS